MQVNLETAEYAGFWARFFATILDSILLIVVLIPLLLMVFGSQIFSNPDAANSPLGNLLQFGLPLLATVLFWKYRSATPGKMLMGLIVVDGRTGGVPPTGRLVLRYFAYIVSALPLGLGYLWVAFDKRKRGFHDMIAGTLVVRKPAGGA